MKVCSKCHIKKDESEFYSCKANKDGLHRWCVECSKAAKKMWIKKNQDHVKVYGKEYGKQYRLKNIEAAKKRAKLYYELNKDIIKAKVLEWYSENKDGVIKRVADWQKQNKPKKLKYQKSYRDANKAKSSEYAKNPEVVKKQKEYIKRKIDGLHDDYLRMLLIKWNGFSKQDIESIPQILDKKKLEILILRSKKIIKQQL